MLTCAPAADVPLEACSPDARDQVYRPERLPSVRPPLLGRDDDTVVGQRVPAWVGQLELPRVLAVDQLEDRHRGAVSEEAGGGTILPADIGPSDEVLPVLVGEDQRHRGRVADFASRPALYSSVRGARSSGSSTSCAGEVYRDHTRIAAVRGDVTQHRPPVRIRDETARSHRSARLGKSGRSWPAAWSGRLRSAWSSAPDVATTPAKCSCAETLYDRVGLGPIEVDGMEILADGAAVIEPEADVGRDPVADGDRIADERAGGHEQTATVTDR